MKFHPGFVLKANDNGKSLLNAINLLSNNGSYNLDIPLWLITLQITSFLLPRNARNNRDIIYDRKIYNIYKGWKSCTFQGLNPYLNSNLT